ncbi:MAG: hypothetical protein K0V04_19455 [Deltaproteobacteria bacterium]|nr:hypothetical protein [Deltaproteobacteria bacterium]
MQTTEHGWTIIDAAAGVLSYAYEFTTDVSANTVTARLASGGLLVLSPPIDASRAVADDLAAYGPVEAIVSNNGFHHLGIARWRELFPQARCFAAPGAAARIARKSKNAGDLEPLHALTPLLADGVALLEAPDSKCGETWARVETDDGCIWYGSDIFANLEQLPPNFVVRLLFKWTKSAPGYRLFNFAQKFTFKDRNGALRAVLEDVRAHPPTVMVPAHGAILSGDSLAAKTEAMLVAATS